MGYEPKTIQTTDVQSKTPQLDKTLNSNCDNNVDVINKYKLKNKRQDSPKKVQKEKIQFICNESDSDFYRLY